MAELENEARTLNESSALPACSSNTNQRKSYGRKNRNMRNRECGSYPSEQEKNSEIYSHYHATKHGDQNCWRKYAENFPNAQKKIEQQKKTDSRHLISNCEKNNTFFNLVS